MKITTTVNEIKDDLDIVARELRQVMLLIHPYLMSLPDDEQDRLGEALDYARHKVQNAQAML